MKDIDGLGVGLAAFEPRIEACGVRLSKSGVGIDGVISSSAPAGSSRLSRCMQGPSMPSEGGDRIYVAKTEDLLARRGRV